MSTLQGRPGYPPSLGHPDPPQPTEQQERHPLLTSEGSWTVDEGRTAPRTPLVPGLEGPAGPGNVSLSHEDSELRIVLVGKTGGGRSATGNSLLGEKIFESKLSLKPVTQNCWRQVRAEKWEGKQVVVIDTPDIFDPCLPEQQNNTEIQKCLPLCEPGPHALVFVTQVGRFTEEDAVAAKRVEEAFGPEATKYMIVLFTRKEDLEKVSLEEYIEQSGNSALQDLVRKCQDRCCAFNNRGTPEERASQAEELLSLIEKVVQENGEQPYLKLISKQTAAAEPVEGKMNAGEIPEGQKKKKSKHGWW